MSETSAHGGGESANCLFHQIPSPDSADSMHDGIRQK
jgi:hypothetical protein